MRYEEFRDQIQGELQRNAAGLTWAELQQRLDLPYTRPCPTWVARLEDEVGLSRVKGRGPAHVWRVVPDPENNWATNEADRMR